MDRAATTVFVVAKRRCGAAFGPFVRRDGGLATPVSSAARGVVLPGRRVRSDGGAGYVFCLAWHDGRTVASLAVRGDCGRLCSGLVWPRAYHRSVDGAVVPLYRQNRHCFTGFGGTGCVARGGVAGPAVWAYFSFHPAEKESYAVFVGKKT